MKLPLWRKALLSVQMIAAVAFFTTACERIVDPDLPSTAHAFSPPLVYDKWWKMVESCSGVTRPLADVTWFGVSGSSFQLQKELVTGYWSAGSNRVVLADSSRLDGAVVRHEMLHALVRQPGHPRSAFLEKCAGLVSCTKECVADAGPASQDYLSYPAASMDSFDISIQVLPNPPSLSVDGGVFSVVVSARNRTSHPVSLSLPIINGVPAAPFAFEIRALSAPAAAIGGILNLSDPSVTTFAAGETKRQYFDFNIGSVIRNRTIAPAAYRVTGWYATRSVALSPVVIGPP
ncbi:MAG TPA: hypothetical protein VM053_09400 [Gemmatimonadaceae bacterium]|nr:hypothetical protein [Gemmatimonadaceae bacterium]